MSWREDDYENGQDYSDVVGRTASGMGDLGDGIKRMIEIKLERDSERQSIAEQIEQKARERVARDREMEVRGANDAMGQKSAATKTIGGDRLAEAEKTREQSFAEWQKTRERLYGKTNPTDDGMGR